ncbi:minor capsid protein [Anaerospora hongkongensis]|uniref:minor capsid protein n=1 Tax=Anaerospora hongkongensis TaxID=244830 RepID=UPI002899C91D|nr:minor capsid protein [Anaerospora hongkongensis]
MKHRDYWRKRFELLEEEQLKQGLAYYDDLERQYKLAAKSLEDQIAGWYGRFAQNNQISFAEAKRLLNSSELKEFKWTVHEYIKYGKENAVSGQWLKQLENASARVHISRLEALKLQIQQQVEVLYGNQVDGLERTMRNIYSNGYYYTAYEVQRGFNVGYDLQKFNNRQLAAVINKPWTPDGKNFTNRCWTAKDQLVNTLHTELTQTVIRGDSPDRMIKTIAQKFETTKNNAGRLVMTESAFFASAAQRDCFNELDVERYEIVATLDNDTSAICRSLDGKIFLITEYQIGITAPPFHCWCRTVTVPYFVDNTGFRAARNAEGKTYYVPDSMKYEDWKKTFVDGGSKDGLKEITKTDIVKSSFTPSKTIQEAEKYAVDNLGFTKASYKNIDIEVANDVNKSLGVFYEEYPVLRGFVKEMRVGDMKATASAGMDIVNGRPLPHLTLSKRDLSDLAGVNALIDKAVNLKWWTPKNGASGILNHELAHMLEYITTMKKYGVDLNTTDVNLINKAFRAIKNGELSGKIKTEALKKLNLVNEKGVITENLSGYGFTDSLEFLAEAVSESNPRPLAQEVVKLLKEEMERIFNDSST